MLRSKTATAIIVGFILTVAGLVWGAVYEQLQAVNDPPGWIMDREFYPPARVTSEVGFYVFGLAILFAIARWIYTELHAAPR